MVGGAQVVNLRNEPTWVYGNTTLPLTVSKTISDTRNLRNLTSFKVDPWICQSTIRSAELPISSFSC